MLLCIPAKRVYPHKFALQGVWRSALDGSLHISGPSLAFVLDDGSDLWITWRRVALRQIHFGLTRPTTVLRASREEIESRGNWAP